MTAAGLIVDTIIVGVRLKDHPMKLEMEAPECRVNDSIHFRSSEGHLYYFSRVTFIIITRVLWKRLKYDNYVLNAIQLGNNKWHVFESDFHLKPLTITEIKMLQAVSSSKLI